MNQTIYIVATSDYDGHVNILGVFTSRERAEIAKERIHDCELIVWEITDQLPEVPEGKLPWNVRLTIDGNPGTGDSIWRESCLGFEEPGPERPPYCGNYYYQVWAESEFVALKRAQEFHKQRKLK